MGLVSGKWVQREPFDGIYDWGTYICTTLGISMSFRLWLGSFWHGIS